MSLSFRACCLILLAWLGHSSLGLAQKIRFEARLSNDQAQVGQGVQLDFILEGERASGAGAEVPRFPKELSVQGPNTSVSYTYVNGKSSIQQIYSYILTPLAAGTYRIEGAKITTSTGQILQTQALTLKVSQANASDLSSQEAVFIRLVPNRNEVLVGEQFLLDLKIYTQQNLSQLRVLRQPELQGAAFHFLKSGYQKTEVERINGKAYTTTVLQRLSVFPNQVGELEILPAQVQASVEQTSHRGFLRHAVPIALLSNAPKIRVLPLPQDENNADFQGLTGTYALEAYVDKSRIDSDGAIKLLVRILGQGDLKKILPPKIEGLAYFDTAEPNVREEIQELGQGVGGVKEFSYVLLPKALGEFQIRPKITFFHTGQRAIKTLDTLIQLEVMAGGQMQLPDKKSLENLLVPPQELQALKQGPQAQIDLGQVLDLNTTSSTNSLNLKTDYYWFLYALFGLPLALFLWPLWNKRQNNKTKKQKRSNKQDAAETLLAKGLQAWKQGQTNQALETWSLETRRHLSQMLELQAWQVSLRDLELALQHLQANPDLELGLQALRLCDQHRYDSNLSQNIMQNIYDNLIKLLRLAQKPSKTSKIDYDEYL